MLDKISNMRPQIIAVANKHKVERLWVFGSCARKEETPESDVDFLVEFNDSASLLDHGRLYNELAILVGRGVDVVDRAGVVKGSPFERIIERDLVAV